MRLKVLSWNIWIDSNPKDIEQYLKAADSDIVGLQEVQADKPGRNTIGFMESLGYHSVFSPATKMWGGNTYKDGCAIFSKFPIVENETWDLSPNESRVAVRADIDAGRVLHVFCTHLIHTHQQEMELQNNQIKKLASVVTREHTVVMGDFNATPQSTPIKTMRALLTDTDPTDQPTWSVFPAGCSGCNPPTLSTRLDYIFASSDLKIHSFAVGDSRASDHLPISVEIEI